MRLWLSFDGASYEAAAPADEVIEMRRREFITGLGSTRVTWPPAACAQQPMIPVVGFLHPGSLDTFAPLVAEFRQGLKESGFTEGHNVAIEYLWAEGQYDRLPTLAAELVRHHCPGTRT